MAKQNKYNLQHQRNINRYLQQIDEIFREAAREAAKIGMSLTDYNPDVPFSFADYPSTLKKIERLSQTVNSNLSAIIVNGIRSEWTLANNKNNELCRQVFGDNIGRLSSAQYRRYFNNNEKAREAFIIRKERGLRLSDRVWNYTTQFKEEIEMGLDLGIGQGLSADELSRELRDYLKHPDKLFRRVRDKHGQLHLSKAAAAFHPGQGVYRSSYKNARRLAATEGNIAYRTADHERWQTMSFVVGFEIKLSNNHTCLNDQGKAVRFHCICDDLQGKYPKDFKFTGWHPHCRCFAIPILKTEEEMAEDNKRILRGEEVTNGGVNQVNDVPKAFKDWLADNEARLQRVQKSLPYFLAENPKYLDVTPQMQSLSGFRGTKLGRQATKDAMKIYDDRPAPTLTSEQRTNINDIAKALNTTPNPMTFLEADDGKANVGYGRREYGYNTNCAATVLIHEARLRGLNITALPYSPNPNGLSFQLGENTAIGWRTEKGKTPTVTTLKAKSDDELFRKLDGQTKAAGRYHIGINFDQSHGHIITAERFSDGKIVFYDAQSGAFLNIKEYPDLESIEVLKVDKLLFAPDIIKAICRLL